MPATLQSFIDWMDVKFEVARQDFYELRIGFNWLGVNLAAQDWSSAQTTCNLMRDTCRSLQDNHAGLTSSTRYYLVAALEYINDNAAFEAPEFDMDVLLSAMVGADPAQVMYFIGLVDAYRQSVWNRPFNQEFFAALARGFAQWE